MSYSLRLAVLSFAFSTVLSIPLSGETWIVSRHKKGKFHAKDLQTAIDKAKSGDKILIDPGVFEAKPVHFTDSLCGNCLEHRTTVPATYGFIVRDKAVTIQGVDRSSTILKTNAGYGILFHNSRGSTITNLTITGGIRDTSGDATNAGIVARFSQVTIARLDIINDTARSPNIVVGIGGIFGREGSELIIRDNYIANNSWDGIALYRGASAFIADNVIDKGRGVGIGITWNAIATVLRNSISNYWKGIGTFGSSRAVVRNNLVSNNLGWGLVVTGSSFMEASNNSIVKNGNCGIAPWDSSARGVFTNNIVALNGWRKEWVCPCVGFWMNGVTSNFEISYNNVWRNSAGDYKDISSQTSLNGNISIDPEFADSLTFFPRAAALRHSGNPAVSNTDGSRSHIGPNERAAARR